MTVYRWKIFVALMFMKFLKILKGFRWRSFPNLRKQKFALVMGLSTIC